MTWTLHRGDCRDYLRSLPEASVSAVVTDPPYELGFMGRKWDSSGIAYSVDLWQECLRVCKPGAHLIAFGGARTYHRLACAVEDAGWEVRDQGIWIYGSGFPKSLDVSKAIDREAGVLGHEGHAFTVAGYSHAPDKIQHTAPSRGYVPPAPATPAARQWQGWGTALKPAHEPFVIARKPFRGTVAENVLEHGTGAINVEACKVGTESMQGRWPANLIHDGSEAVEALFPESTAGTETKPRGKGGIWSPSTGTPAGPQYGDSGSAARFFYAAKASREEREHGLVGFRNVHPTVKPLALMRHLVRLVTPPGGLVLDPFAGSGTTMLAAIQEGFDVAGCELTEEYWPIIAGRCECGRKEEEAKAKSELPLRPKERRLL